MTGAGAVPGAVPIVVLPYAGAVTSPASLIPAVQQDGRVLFGATLPGHGTVAGPVLDDPEHLLRLLDDDLDELAASWPAPVLVGFSMGGRLAYELARRRTTRGTAPAGLVVCVSRAPHTGIGHPPLAGLSDAKFAVQAVRLGLVIPELLGLPGTATLLRALRADLAIVERMPTANGPALPVPATVIGATGDWLVTEPALRRWADLVAGPRQARIPGTHLGWLQNTAEMAAAVARGIAHATGGTGAA